MSRSGESQEQPDALDQEGIWDAAPAEDEASEPDGLAVDPAADDPVEPRPRRVRRPGLTSTSGGSWTQSLASTATLPGPAGSTLADLPNRVVALVLDLLLLAFVGVLLAIVVGGLFGGMTSGGGSGGSLDDAGGSLNLAAFLVVAVAQLAISFAYFGYGWVVLRGTVGMLILGLRIVDEGNGRAISWDQALLRWLLLGVPVTLATFAVSVPDLVGLLLGIVGLAWLALLLSTMVRNAGRQGVQDRRAHTVIVRIPRRST